MAGPLAIFRQGSLLPPAVKKAFCLALVLLLAPLTTTTSQAEDATAKDSDWRYGAYLDLSYAADFNEPDNHRWRSKSTTTRMDLLAPNMAFGYVRKKATPSSRWGMELLGQAGYDTEGLVPQPIPERQKPIDGADALRHIGQANVSYLAPVGQGLTLTAGLFKSYIGYQSFYAKNNLNYTRTYIADNSPYLLFGVGARYPVNEALTLGLYVVNGYSYLSQINDQPRYGTQLAWKPTSRLTVTQNILAGPEQANTGLQFWRFFSDSIVEWKHDRLTLALAYDIGTEEAAEQSAHPRTFWTGGALYAHWKLVGPWSVAVRPEFYWDRNGRLTGSDQLIKAITTTAEYRLLRQTQEAVLRLEYRYDESTGPGGGFFSGRTVAPTGLPSLTPGQQLLLFSVIWSFDS